MKSEKITIRVTDIERENLEEKAKGAKKSVSEYIRFLIFSKKESDYCSILEQLSLIQQNQKDQLACLTDINLRSKKNLRHNVILSSSTFQIRYVMSKIVSMLGHVYGKSLPGDFDFANNKAKEEFIKTEAEKVAIELEAINR
ncbi:MAG: hypothetical protein HQK53_08500 [Oligoflexia bacterium]|nr:hypothetical protein [Oligoflexia bacterium]